MPRGGRRPGAGAPVGNMNALKHGQASARFQALVVALGAHPTTREALLRIARRHRRMRREAERTASLLLRELLFRCLVSLKLNQTEDQAANTDGLLDALLFPDQSNANTPPRNQSEESEAPAR